MGQGARDLGIRGCLRDAPASGFGSVWEHAAWGTGHIWGRAAGDPGVGEDRPRGPGACLREYRELRIRAWVRNSEAAQRAASGSRL